MKLEYLIAPLVVLLAVSTGLRADDDLEIKSDDDKVEVKDDRGDREFKMKIEKDDDGYVGVHEERKYKLRGDAMADFDYEADREYRVWGRMSDDGYIETTRIRPVLVEREVRVDEPVVRERIEVEDDDPVLKVGPLEIND